MGVDLVGDPGGYGRYGLGVFHVSVRRVFGREGIGELVYTVITVKLVAEFFVDLAQEAGLDESKRGSLDAFFALIFRQPHIRMKGKPK
jgi:hypothetical protein